MWFHFGDSGCFPSDKSCCFLLQCYSRQDLLKRANFETYKHDSPKSEDNTELKSARKILFGKSRNKGVRNPSDSRIWGIWHPDFLLVLWSNPQDSRRCCLLTVIKYKPSAVQKRNCNFPFTNHTGTRVCVLIYSGKENSERSREIDSVNLEMDTFVLCSLHARRIYTPAECFDVEHLGDINSE